MEESKEGNYLKHIKKGMRVTIETREKKEINGVVDELGSRKEFHPQGIMVMLKTGEVGRVKKIHDSNQESNLERFIKRGESYTTEFKKSALWSVLITEQEIQSSKSFELHSYKKKASKVIIAKSIAALLNSSGGYLFIGVEEKKDARETIVVGGIEEDLAVLKNEGKDATFDGYKRMLIDDIIRPFFPATIYNHLHLYVTIDFERVKGKTICVLKIKKSDIMVFLQVMGKKLFMIRIDTETRQIRDEELVNYCMKRFG